MGDIKEGGFQQKKILKKNQSEMLEKYSKTQIKSFAESLSNRTDQGGDRIPELEEKSNRNHRIHTNSQRSNNTTEQ